MDQQMWMYIGYGMIAIVLLGTVFLVVRHLFGKEEADPTDLQALRNRILEEERAAEEEAKAQAQKGVSEPPVESIFDTGEGVASQASSRPRNREFVSNAPIQSRKVAAPREFTPDHEQLERLNNLKATKFSWDD